MCAMKFWVKAITDKNVQEQLLVDAESLDELTKELSSLLNTCVTSISVSDFQSQVVDKINSGTDIVTVNVGTSTTCSDSNSKANTNTSHFETSVTSTGHWLCNDAALSLTEDDEWLCSTASTAIAEGTPVRRTLVANQLLLDATPQIDRICLRRDQLELLLRPSHRGAYHSVITGCFARMRWRQGYSLYQIVRPASDQMLVFDMIHYEETHGMEVVSNAPPVAQELTTWGKRMRAASRPFVTAGFIEAKVGDVNSALRTARGSSVERPSLQPQIMVPSTPPASSTDSYPRRARKTLNAYSPSLAFFSFDRLLIKTNDTLKHSQFCIVNEPEMDSFSVVIFASRFSNTYAKKPRRSDFAGCMITLDKNARTPGIASERDITEKGYEMLCSPQWWGCRYIALVRPQPTGSSEPYIDSRGICMQDFTVLSGRFLSSLFNPPTTTSLPVPTWATGEGLSANILRPQLVVHHKKLHVFYLISIVTSSPVRRLCSVRLGACEPLNVGAVSSNANADSQAAEGGASLDGSFANSGALPHRNRSNSPALVGICQYSLAHAVCEGDAFGQWHIVSDEEPLLSCQTNMPVFTAASVPAVDAKREKSIVSDNSPESDPLNVLQLLWYEGDASDSQSSAPSNQSTLSSASRSNSVSNRPLLPFERWVNTHEDASPDAWEQEPSYSAVRINTELMKSGVCSLSLCEHEGMVLAASVNRDAQQRTVVMVAPLTTEP